MNDWALLGLQAVVAVHAPAESAPALTPEQVSELASFGLPIPTPEALTLSRMLQKPARPGTREFQVQRLTSYLLSPFGEAKSYCDPDIAECAAVAQRLAASLVDKLLNDLAENTILIRAIAISDQVDPDEIRVMIQSDRAERMQRLSEARRNPDRKASPGFSDKVVAYLCSQQQATSSRYGWEELRARFLELTSRLPQVAMRANPFSPPPPPPSPLGCGL